MSFSFQIIQSEGAARVGRVHTPHGSFDTPAFMPVGTHATVKAMTPEEVKETGAQILLCNAYHLYLRPGQDLVREMGGLHAFMNWKGPILTDSGGFQVYSLAPLRTIDEAGVTFRSHIDGTEQRFTPESVMHLQHDLGADIIMCLDECTPYPVTYEYAQKSIALTIRWAERCRAAHPQSEQALFGIVQGGVFRDLRAQCAEALIAMDFPGYALGGLMIGEDKDLTWSICHDMNQQIPASKPRYLMGVGRPEDFLNAIAHGIDMFDCVVPTRLARMGHFLTWQGRRTIKQARFRRDKNPPDPQCPCYCCQNYSLAYLRHLFQAGEILAARLATLHNLTFFQSFMQCCRREIQQGTFQSFRESWFRRQGQSSIDSSLQSPDSSL